MTHSDGKETNIQQLLTNVGQTKNVIVFAILDCCRKSDLKKAAEVTRAFAKLDHFICFGCREFESTVGSTKNGRFSRAILTLLKSKAVHHLPKDIIEMKEMEQYGD